jgi:hypothetical protein
MPPLRATNSNRIPNAARHLRRLAGIPKSRRQASVTPPALYQGTAWSWGCVRAALVAAVVEMVSVAVPAETLVMLTGEVEPKLRVGGYCAPVGLDVMAAVSATAPVNPLLGVIVIVDWLPVVAPGATVTELPVIAKLGFATVVTVTVFAPFDVV